MPVQWDDASKTGGVQWDEEAPAKAPAPKELSGRDLMAKSIMSSGFGTQPYGSAEAFEKTASRPNLDTAGAMGGTLAGSRFGPPGRVVGGGVGGGVGGYIEHGPSGILPGAAKGAGLNVLAELIPALGGKLLRSGPGAKGRIAETDALNLGQEIGRQSPPLAGAQTANELRGLAAGPGRDALGAAKETAIQEIERQLTGPLNIQGSPRTLREANDLLSTVGARAFGKNPLERNILGVDQRQLYGQIANEIEMGLPANLRPAWQTAQADYKKGLALLKPLQSSSAVRQYPSEVQLNTPALQSYIANPKNEAALRNKLGDEGFEALVNVLTRGGGIGTRDILASGQGRMRDALLQTIGRGTNTGSVNMLGVPVRTFTPNVGSEYAGTAPYTMPPALRTILDLATQAQGDR